MHHKLAEGDQPIPHYRLDKRLGAGTFGEVWRAIGPGGVAVAMKVIPLTRSTGARELRSILPLRDIRHPHLVPITGLWILDENGEVMTEEWLVEPSRVTKQPVETVSTLTPEASLSRPELLIVAMGLCELSLGDLLETYKQRGTGSVPLGQLVEYLKEAAKGLDFLNSPVHQLGGQERVAIQHRDVKPANILLLGDSAVICDFGVACVLQDQSVTATDMVGSPAYMAPESIEARRTTQATDQYALAITYYELRTGHLPFRDATNQVAVMNAHLKGDLVFDDCPAAEQAVLRQATAIDPADRFESCTALMTALDEASRGIMPPARSQRHGAAKRWGLVAAAMVLIGAVVWIWKGDALLSLVSKSDDHAQVQPVPKGEDTERIAGSVSNEANVSSSSDGVASASTTPDATNDERESSGDGAGTKDPNGSAAQIENSIGMILLPLGPAPAGSAPRPLLSATEVTQAQWEALMGTRPWEGKSNVLTNTQGHAPASYVSWHDAVEFCRKLSEKEGRHYRLPKESEWEYACRAGSNGSQPNDMQQVAWFKTNALQVGEKYPHPVAQKSPNAWGFYDMHGNVREWCDDVFGSDVDQTSEFRVLRGGSWADSEDECGLNGRHGATPDVAYDDTGFRLTLDPSTAP